MQRWKGLENEGRMDKMAQWVERYANVRTRTRMPSIRIHARWAMRGWNSRIWMPSICMHARWVMRAWNSSHGRQRQGLPEASWLPTLAKPSGSGVK